MSALDGAYEGVGGRAAPPAWWRRLAWRRPEWWCLALSAAAWCMLVARMRLPTGGAAGTHHGHHPPPAPTATGGIDWAGEWTTWLLMVLAMMTPLVLGAIRVTAARSLWRRRDLAVGEFLVGYVGRWLIVGLLAAFAVAALDARGWLSPPVAAAGFAVAALWQLTPAKGRALRSCHRTVPLTPRGLRADLDCLRFGWLIGGRCVVSCWAMMLACVLAGHGLAAMACVGLIGAAERYLGRPHQRIIVGALTGLALVYASTALR